MEPKLTEHSKQAIANSRDEAIRLKNGAIGVEHLFLGILREDECSAVQLLRQMGADLSAAKSRLENMIGQLDSDIRYSMDSEIPMLRQTEKILRLSFLESTRHKAKEIHTVHMLLAMLQEGENTVSQILQQYNISYKRCIDLLQQQGEIPPSSSTENQPPSVENFLSQTSEDDNDDPYADPDSEQQPRYSAAGSEVREQNPGFGELRARPHPSGTRREARPHRRPRERTGAHRPNPLPPQKEQPHPHRRTRRGQERHCRGSGTAHRRRPRAAHPLRQTGHLARPRLPRGRHQIPRPVRGTHEGRAQRAGKEPRHHCIYRRDTHHRRCRQCQRLPRCLQHVQARPCTWRNPVHRHHHP